MKKLLAFLCATLFSGITAAAARPVPAAAETELPFPLTAPANVTMTYLGGRDSDNTVEISYSQSAEMSKFFSDKETNHDAWVEARNAEGIDDIWVNAQIDWSLDTQDDWHVNDYWLTEGYDADYHQHLGDWAYYSAAYSPETTMSDWIFRWMGNIDDPEDAFWVGNSEGVGATGWSTVLKEGQYDVIGTDEGHTAKIDFTAHTLYARVRWRVTVRPPEGEDTVTVSDWSEIASVGKDAVKAEKLKPGDIAAPVISGLRYTDEDFNGQPVIAFTLAVDDTLAKQLAQASGTQGGISLETEARLKGKTDWRVLQGDWTVKSGEMQMDLLGIEEDAGGKVEAGTPIELRARYRCAQNGEEDFFSDYSEVLTFDAVEMTTPAPDSAADNTTSATPYQEAPPKPASLWWLWVLLILLIIIIIVVIVILRAKKQKKG